MRRELEHFHVGDSYGGVTGSADAAARALAEGTLQYDPNAKCDHHGHHHGEGHECGHQEGDAGCRRHESCQENT